MINTAIWGTEKISALIKQIIEKIYNKEALSQKGDALNVVGFVKEKNDTAEVHETISEDDIFSLNQIAEKYNHGQIDIIIVPIDLYMGANDIVFSMINCNISLNDIYLFERSALYSSDHIEDMIEPFLSKSYLPYLEYHVADHCNLKCRGCEHYSGLVETPKFPVFDDFELQFTKLKSLINDIGVIRILGGEPLLNKELGKYMVLTRKLYPYASICIVTNALLIKSMSDEFYELMRRENIYFSISFYPPLENSMADIINILKEKNVKYMLFDMVKEFTIKQTLRESKDNDYFFRCIQARCTNFYEGKLAACFLPFMTCYFNESFKNQLNEPLPSDGGIDIMGEKLSVKDIKTRLFKPFERCRYCTDPVSINWSVIGKEKKLEDWVQIK